MVLVYAALLNIAHALLPLNYPASPLRMGFLLEILSLLL